MDKEKIINQFFCFDDMRTENVNWNFGFLYEETEAIKNSGFANVIQFFFEADNQILAVEETDDYKLSLSRIELAGENIYVVYFFTDDVTPCFIKFNSLEGAETFYERILTYANE